MRIRYCKELCKPHVCPEASKGVAPCAGGKHTVDGCGAARGRGQAGFEHGPPLPLRVPRSLPPTNLTLRVCSPAASRVLGIYAFQDRVFLCATFPTYRLRYHVRRLVHAGHKVCVRTLAVGSGRHYRALAACRCPIERLRWPFNPSGHASFTLPVFTPALSIPCRWGWCGRWRRLPSSLPPSRRGTSSPSSLSSAS